MEFHNKTVIITGASVGIGKATAIEFARNGANVCIVDVNAEGLVTLAEEIKLIGANDERAVPTQPTIKAAKAVRDNLDYLPDIIR